MSTRFVIAALLTLGTLVAAQERLPSTATGVIEGRVVDAGTGQPIAGASVRLHQTRPVRNSPNRSAELVTNTSGAFVFTELPVGSFSVEASSSRGEYISGAFGQRRADGYGVPIPLAAGEHWTGATIELLRQGSIAGQLTDEDGRPLAGQWISAWPEHSGPDWRRYVPTAKTDEAGLYRIDGLGPGNHIVGAVVHRYALRSNNRAEFPRDLPEPRPSREGHRRVFRSTFFGQAVDVSAALPVAVESGQRREGIDIRLLADLPVTVSGRVIRDVPFPQGSDIEILIRDMPESSALEERTLISPDGQFSIVDLAPGDYVAHPVPKESHGDVSTQFVGDDFTYIPIHVPANGLSNLEWPLAHGIAFSARLTYEGPGPVPQIVQSLLLPLDFRQFGRGENYDVPLRYDAVLPGRYELLAFDNNPDSAWRMSRVLLTGREVTGEPLAVPPNGLSGLEVVFSRVVDGVAGSVNDAAGRPVADSTVVMFPTDSSRWIDARLMSLKYPAVRALRGAFGTIAVPPGTYYIAAMDERTMSGWPNVAMMARIASRAQKVAVERGRTATVSLVLK